MPHTVVEVPKGDEGLSVGRQLTRLVRVPQSIQPFHGGVQEQIERLIQEGHLSCYVLSRGEKDRISLGLTRKEAEEVEMTRGERRDEGRGRIDTWHLGVITTISGGGASMAEGNSSRRRRVRDVLAVHMKANTTPLLVITFSERDMRHGAPWQDEPMVISIVTVEYKVEWVLIDQGSSANILYWLYGFASEQVMINGVIKLKTLFGEPGHACSISVLYTVVDVEVTYNIVMGRPTLNKLGGVVSTLHLCMKYSMGQEVGRIWADHRFVWHCFEDSLRIGSRLSWAKESAVNMLDLDLDPRCELEHERP
ncbi:hypothetical protein CR513_19022, partial [Mucuna pruriens]